MTLEGADVAARRPNGPWIANLRGRLSGAPDIQVR